MSAGALFFSLFQVLVHASLSLAGATVIGLLYGWWVLCLRSAERGIHSGFAGLAVFALGWAFAGNGVAELASSPHSFDQWPRNEFPALGNTIFGAVAGIASLHALRGPVRPRAWLVPLALTAAALTTKAAT